MGWVGEGTNTSLEVVRLWNMTLLPSEVVFLWTFWPEGERSEIVRVTCLYYWNVAEENLILGLQTYNFIRNRHGKNGKTLYFLHFLWEKKSQSISLNNSCPVRDCARSYHGTISLQVNSQVLQLRDKLQLREMGIRAVPQVSFFSLLKQTSVRCFLLLNSHQFGIYSEIQCSNRKKEVFEQQGLVLCKISVCVRVQSLDSGVKNTTLCQIKSNFKPDSDHICAQQIVCHSLLSRLKSEQACKSYKIEQIQHTWCCSDGWSMKISDSFHLNLVLYLMSLICIWTSSYEFGFSRISRADQTSSIRKYLAMAGRKNLILTGRDLWHSQAQGGASICCDHLRVRGKSREKWEHREKKNSK